MVKPLPWDPKDAPCGQILGKISFFLLKNMASKLSAEDKRDRIEHYAYRTSDKCVKNEDIKTLVGGWHDWHPLILCKIAKRIFDSFVTVSKELEANQNKVETFHNVNFNDGETKEYRIHIFNLERHGTKRKSMWINAGIFLRLKNDLGYTRIFRMPCK